MSIIYKAEELINFYSKITGYSIQSLNGWMLREMAIGEVERLISELEEIDLRYGLEIDDKDSCLASTSIPYYESVIDILKEKY